MRRRAGSLPNWALGPRVQGTGELGWGQLPFLETQAGPVCLLCASIYSYEGAHACRLPLQRENEVLRRVPAPSSTPAFSQHIISFVRSAAPCRPTAQPLSRWACRLEHTSFPFTYRESTPQEALSDPQLSLPSMSCEPRRQERILQLAPNPLGGAWDQKGVG